MSRFRVSLFGRFHVECEDRSSASGLDARKVQELFSYLLLYRGRPHPRESLADILWNESEGAQSRKYLRQALWQLQSALKGKDGADGDGCLTVESDWVGVNEGAGIWLDVAEFERAYAEVQGKSGHEIGQDAARKLVSAVELHQGSLLEGWYHDWCIFERERLQSMYLAMLNKLMLYFEAQAEYETGLIYGQRILQFDRAHERTHWRMMRLHYLAGDRTAALRQYERCVAALQEELGVKPARWTAALHEQIRADQLRDIGPEAHHPAREAEENPAYPAHLSRLQALIQEFNQEVQQYIHAAGLTTHEQRGAGTSPAE